MSEWQKKIAAITLFVEDVAASKAFYQKVFESSRSRTARQASDSS